MIASCHDAGLFRYRTMDVLKYLLLPFLFILQTSCAHFDKSRPGWDAFGAEIEEKPVTLHVRTVGKGPAVILLHGFAANSATWRYLVPELAKYHAVHMLDLKGFGESPKPDDNAYSIYDQAQLVIDFIKEKQFKQISIVGHSYGGGVALVSSLYLSRQYPGILKQLILIDSIAYEQETPFFINMLATPFLGELVAYTWPTSWQVNNVLKKAYFNDELITDEMIRIYSEPLNKAGAKNAMLTTAKQILPADLNKFSRQYNQIKATTKIIWGDNDEITPLKSALKLHQAIENSSLSIINKCGHIPHEECPEKTIPIIVDFLKND